MTVSNKAKDMMEDGKEAVTKEAEARAEAVRDEMAEQGEKLSNAANKAADEFEGGMDSVESLLAQAGEAVEGATNRLRERSIPDMVDDVSAFARRNPLLFLGGAALAGFAAARFLSASSPSQSVASSDDVWSGHLEHSTLPEARD